ncbi:hypothetical protein RCL1_004364 [Eukaryota sp. TZLM3-RCL]
MKTVGLLVFPGVEPIEAFTCIDVLSRASAKTTIISVFDSSEVLTAHNISINPQTSLSSISDSFFDLVILPGGPGSLQTTLNTNPLLHAFLKNHVDNNKLVCAICAAPITLCNAGLLTEHSATSYPATREAVEPNCKSYYLDKVVISRNIITSRGPGTSLLCALVLVGLVYSPNVAESIAKAMLLCDEDLQILKSIIV